MKGHADRFKNIQYVFRTLFHVKFTNVVTGETFSEAIYRTVWSWESVLDVILHTRIMLTIYSVRCPLYVD
jgi:hypothetical protein